MEIGGGGFMLRGAIITISYFYLLPEFKRPYLHEFLVRSFFKFIFTFIFVLLLFFLNIVLYPFNLFFFL